MKFHDNERLRRASLNLSVQPARRNKLREFKGSGDCDQECSMTALKRMVAIFIAGGIAWAAAAAMAIQFFK